MKLHFAFLLTALALLPLASAAEAITPPAEETLRTALAYRAEMASAVAKNAETAESAVQRLSTRGSASGLPLASEADLGHSALDVGRRLLSLNRPEAAEVFFRAAEQAFAQAASRATPVQAREKAQYLQKLATVRANYLNQAAQAKADIDEAIRLQPGDKALEEARRQLARGRSEVFKENKEAQETVRK